MTGKILIETIPLTDEIMPIRRIIQPRGEVALIEDGREFRHLSYFSIKRGKGFFRGGHYHRRKVEHLYLIDGRVTLTFVDLDSGEGSQIELTAGHRVTIYPGCAHRIDAIEDARVIEYFNSVHDPSDDHPFDPMRESC